VNDLIVDAFRLDLAAKLIAAILIGGGIGLERELKGKPAGLRTNILICVGSALLMDLSMNLAAVHGGDPGRIAAQVVTGIGFLGAGTILHTRGQITGLTSAATIWVVAALGLTIGAEYFVEALGSTVTVMIVLVGLGWVERRYLNDAQEAHEAKFAQARATAHHDGDHRAGGRRATDRRGLPNRERTDEFHAVDPNASPTRRTDGGT
jgi:putative Mg2+ transporter-C (MgtC) family protein